MSESASRTLLDDDVHESADDQLAALKAFDADAGQSSAALAQSLGSYAALAEELQARLVEVDTAFDPALIIKALSIPTIRVSRSDRLADHGLLVEPRAAPSEFVDRFRLDVMRGRGVADGDLSLVLAVRRDHCDLGDITAIVWPTSYHPPPRTKSCR